MGTLFSSGCMPFLLLLMQWRHFKNKSCRCFVEVQTCILHNSGLYFACPFLLLQSVLDFKAPAFNICLKHYVLCCGFEIVLQLYKNLLPCIHKTVKYFLNDIAHIYQGYRVQKIALDTTMCTFGNLWNRVFILTSVGSLLIKLNVCKIVISMKSLKNKISPQNSKPRLRKSVCKIQYGSTIPGKQSVPGNLQNSICVYKERWDELGSRRILSISLPWVFWWLPAN